MLNGISRKGAKIAQAGRQVAPCENYLAAENYSSRKNAENADLKQSTVTVSVF